MDFRKSDEMKVLFVNYAHLDSNSGIHIFNLANQLTELGAECTVCVPKQKETVAALGEPSFETLNIADFHKNKSGRTFDLIHFWTPRQVVRKMAVKLLGMYPCPYVVHLEDNEEFLIEAYTGLSPRTLSRLPSFLLDLVIPSYMSHPIRYKRFLARANGITVITDALRNFSPVNIPSEIVWAGYQEDLDWDMPRDFGFKQRLGIADRNFVVVYTGNVHAANRQEVGSLYQAIALMRSRGYAVKLVRTGMDHVRFLDSSLNAMKNEFCIDLGRVPRSQLPSILSIADALVQPGTPGPFNDYRFPSKVPEYLASGRPLVLPKANIGMVLKDHEECLLLEKGDAVEIAQKLEELFSNEVLRKKIGSAGRNFAEQHLKWNHIAGKLYSFYLSLV
jgi:glycosyltransferase involved in cell wall biosynthesis